MNLSHGYSYHGHVGEPLQQSKDPFKIITDGAVGHPVVVHDLNAAKLIVGCVNFSAQHLTQKEKGGDFKRKSTNYIFLKF